jgi:hypothetical protein
MIGGEGGAYVPPSPPRPVLSLRLHAPRGFRARSKSIYCTRMFFRVLQAVIDRLCDFANVFDTHEKANTAQFVFVHIAASVIA